MSGNEEAEKLKRAIEAIREGGADLMVKREYARLVLDAYLELEHAICWETTCLNCSRLLDSSYGEYNRGYESGLRAGRAEFGSE